ncbi:MAG: TonB-dependent receptor [Phenylobacterium sp.]|uniref:TonB-dependent receptor plug domain-containing protein n=1 Tax=Phenylobacterium sp. TaxID=1871053 RepID=UPI001B47A452|nr:TonB-dependent receptor [Phenylobacterium sp.]MBP7817028.1 TonB-dependent receptor [Phenylobacterium sp.]MBP9230971.1 TonB-dependent receptor [Phenylobacterium sp.]MBP9753494.1 TonB-dependent receptor [Phenylobacterium sp.]
MKSTTRNAWLASVSLASVLIAGAASAQTLAAAAAEVDEVIVTGTRQTGLKVEDSAAPVQVVDTAALTRTGQTDLRVGLANLVPSFNAQAFGGDTANLTLSARLRGLSPNHALVLINGKRRHTTANFAVLSGAYQGAAATDLSFIPMASIGRIEVLTDGAAAQYGTDAIAGVINVILKKNSEGGSISATGGEYIDEGGKTAAISLNIGTAPTENSYLNLTAETKYHGFSNRGLADQRSVNPASPSYSATHFAYESTLPGFPNFNLISGDAEYRLSNLGYNGGISVTDDLEIYSFGSYGHKDASAYENYRRYNRVQGKMGAADRPYPAGFSPRERIIEDDYAGTLGISGAVGGWNFDLSSTYGVDDIEVRVEDSITASLYADTSTLTAKGFSPTSFHAGSWTTTQLTNNLDLSKEFEVGLATPLAAAFGFENRHETYEIGAGEPASRYKEGSQSYPGFALTDAGKHSRDSWAIYADLAVSPVEALQLDVAVRYEHFSDFGETTVAKLTGRYDFNDYIAVRGTASTGFRAPTLAESFYSATNVSPTSAFVQLAPNSPAARLLGIDALKPEESTNYSIGIVAHPLPAMTLTLDAYQIELTDRIFGSSSLYGTRGGVLTSPQVLAAILANGNVLDPTVTTTGINIFSNGLDTRSRGVDLVISYPTDLGDYGRIDWSLSGNYNTTKVTKVKAPPAPLATPSVPFPAGQTLFAGNAKSLLETASPKYKLGLNALYSFGALTVNLTETVYGKSSALSDPGTGPLLQTSIGTTAITDLEVSYKFFDAVTVSIGANNLFNKYPDKLSAQFQAACVASGGGCVAQYPTYSPFGINGGYYYGRVTYAF